MPLPVTFSDTEMHGVREVHVPLIGDARGFFTELYNRRAWTEAGFDHAFVQDNLSSSSAGTLRGMHYQMHPRAMGKLVRVLRGRIFDVAVDMRAGSPHYGQWVGRELSGENCLALWIPPGFAHGFLALEDDSLVYYKCTETHAPEFERAFHHADPAVGIDWPAEPRQVSEKDQAAPPLAEAENNFRHEG